MKFLILLVTLLLAGGGVWWFVDSRAATPAASPVRFAEVARGPISVTVTATGQIQPVTQVDVGTEVSGKLQEINVDFNSVVKAGQILARLNTDNLSARVAQNRANLRRAKASVERLRVESSNAQRQAKRLEELEQKAVVAKADRETAEMNRDSLVVQIQVGEAEIEQAETTLKQSQIDLDHATITSPIDGVVIERSVEVGQTVAASFNSPLLFRIANDLRELEIRASIDEADIGRVQRAIAASFNVDAFSGRTFAAKLSQVRLNPVVTNNVVIYTCIFNVDNRNPDGTVGPLLPGLTANLTILIDAREDALLVPAAALRYQPKSGAESRRAASAPAGTNGHTPAMPGAPTAVVWVKSTEPGVPDGTVRAVPVTTGLSDGVFTEVIRGDLKAGDFVAIGQLQADAPGSGSFNPFGGMGSGNRGGMGGGGGRPGGGRGGGR